MHGRFPEGLNAAPTADAAKITATSTQILAGGSIFAALTASILAWPLVGAVLLLLGQIAFLGIAAWRLLTVMVRLRHLAEAVETPPPSVLPRYSIVVALYDEAAILPHLVERLANIDYPPELLDGYLALEAHDHATIRAARALTLPDWLHILVVPPGSPTTKPRALNHALSIARGELLTVYDAEDAPDPLQLREAAARFAVEDGELVCLQAPLRIRRVQGARQVAFSRSSVRRRICGPVRHHPAGHGPNGPAVSARRHKQSFPGIRLARSRRLGCMECD